MDKLWAGIVLRVKENQQTTLVGLLGLLVAMFSEGIRWLNTGAADWSTVETLGIGLLFCILGVSASDPRSRIEKIASGIIETEKVAEDNAGKGEPK